MRNLFDQYDQAENRLTHALVCSLAEDSRLLRRFIRWSTGRAGPSGRIEVVEQQRPGEEGRSDLPSTGLPDAWIFNDDNWCLLIESKITAHVGARQLQRHLATAANRGFTQVRLLLLTARSEVPTVVAGVTALRWTDVYGWLLRARHWSDWAGRCAEFMEILESQLIEDNKLQEGGLTTFSGIPFDAKNPYSYLEAKRLLKMAVDELRQSYRLKRELRIDAAAPGRGAITGKRGAAVWDFLRLKHSKHADTFTRYPHLTLAIEHDRLLAIVTVPNGIQPAFRRSLIGLGAEGFGKLMSEINDRLLKALRGERGAAPMLIVVQRRYLTQRSPATLDAKLEFDLRTAFQKPGMRGKRHVKQQPQWLTATYEALSTKRSNLQVAIGASFSFSERGYVHERAILTRIADTWIACKPLLSAMGLKMSG